MTSDVLTRARAALGIEAEPEVHPLATLKPAGQRTQLPDQATIADVLQRARMESLPPSALLTTEQQNVMRRVEIMMTGSVSRIRMVSNSFRDLQTHLFQQPGGNRLELRATVFLDGCRHTTPWSHSPVDVGNGTTAWHCFQGETRYSEALAHSANDGEPIDAIVVFGDRFDDNLPHTLGIVDQLQKRGTRIYAFHVGRKPSSRHAYEQLAERTGGAFVQLSDQRAFARLLPVIAGYLLRPAETLRALPAPRDADTKALVDKLKLLPPPAASLRLTGRTS